jgi:hypothetical protein
VSARRGNHVAVAALVALVAACGHASGVEPIAESVAKVDPEVEPLPPSPKRRMRDPRGVPVLDAGSAAAAMPEVLADAGVLAAATDASASADSTGCGSRPNPCPLQRFMHGAMETAHTADTLTAAFTRVAGMSPDPAWAWVAIATRGADLANAGEVAGAKAQCKACHDAYQEPYRQLHRARKL